MTPGASHELDTTHTATSIFQFCASNTPPQDTPLSFKSERCCCDKLHTSSYDFKQSEVFSDKFIEDKSSCYETSIGDSGLVTCSKNASATNIDSFVAVAVAVAIQITV